MGKHTATRRERLVIGAIDPGTGSLFAVTISLARIRAACRSHGQALEAAQLVPMILQRPRAIFEGLRREADEPHRGSGWRCYVGIPDRAYDQRGNRREPWPNEVFLVFVSDDFIAYNWYWYSCSEDNSDLPEGHAERFRKRLL